MYQEQHISGRAAGFVALLFLLSGYLGLPRIAHAKNGDFVPWIAAGGGAIPSMNQVSLEEDLRLMSRIMPTGGQVLFAGGGDHKGVMVSRRTGRSRGLLQVLGEIFSPRPGRDAFYRQTLLKVDSAFSRDGLVASLERALNTGTEALLFFVAAHGEMGARPAENYVSLWSNESLSVTDLSHVFDAARGNREVRAVITACFSGGFADMIFHSGEQGLGVGRPNRCGFFSAPWDRVSSGCDPDPVRQHHEGYAIHFLNAFGGQSRTGKALPQELSDLDGRGGLSMLEAHSYVRVVSNAVDVPTTTSERWLRFIGLDSGPIEPVFLPEEEYVVRELSKRLGIGGDLHRAREQLAVLEYERALAEERLSQVQDEEYRAYRKLSAVLLNRWPLLDDPWHPDYPALLRKYGEAISRFLAESPLYAEYSRTLRRHDAYAGQLDDLMRRQAPYLRLVRALNTLSWAGQLKAQGGPAWVRYRELLTCERWVPPLKNSQKTRKP